MREDIEEQWMAALLSGDYEQGREFLAVEDFKTGEVRYCCLGVLCKLAEQAGVVRSRKTSSGSIVFYDPTDETGNDRSATVLPNAVVRWAQLPSTAPDVMYEADWRRSLVSINDGGTPFVRIARLIAANRRML